MNKTLAGVAVMVAGAALRAQAPATPRPAFDAFEVATIKPSNLDLKGGRYMRMQTTTQFLARNYQIRILISAAYNLSPQAVVGGPAWIDSDRYEIVAKSPGEVRPTVDEQMAMLRRLLAERFNLKFHRETKEMAIYALTVAKSGLKMRASAGTSDATPEGPAPLAFVIAPEMVRLPGRAATVAELATVMQRAALARPVVDRTGLTGRYDFDLEFAPDESLFGGMLGGGTGDATKPGLFAALQEQLGLRLDSTRGGVSSIVIDRIDRPSEN